jgi:NAD(P)-dependent dehydrogenase (short-subunit alcohol dehydrogenase family)
MMLPIPGASSIAHLEDNLAAAGIHLTGEQFAQLRDAVTKTTRTLEYDPVGVRRQRRGYRPLGRPWHRHDRQPYENSYAWFMKMNHGKVAAVTGASKGIGLAITRALAAEGVSVAAGARAGSGELSELASRSPVHPVLVDLTTADGPSRLVEEATRTFGGLDILVNNVGAVRPRLDGFLALTDDDWEWVLTINFLAAVRTTRAALPHLLDRAPATIVTVSSVNAFLPDPVVIDCSGVAATVARAKDGHPEEVAKQAAAEASTGFTRPQEVADLVLLLASHRAGNVTGTDVLIDGRLVKTL